jgi:hypothetical protein
MNDTTKLDAAVLEVMAAVPYVKKSGKVEIGNTGRSYSYAGEADLIAKLRPAMLAAGLSMTPEDMSVVLHEQYATKYGSMNRVVVKVAYRLSHTSGQSKTVVALGEGADSGDKSTPKAMTCAMKYALRQAFGIETGDDPDKTPSSKQTRKEPGEAFLKARRLVSEAGSVKQLAFYASKYRTSKLYSKEEVAELDQLAAKRRGQIAESEERIPEAVA